MQKALKSVVVLPVVSLLLIALPVLLLSWAGSAQPALGQTVPPPTTLPPTVVPLPTEEIPEATPTFVPPSSPLPTPVPPVPPLSALPPAPRPGYGERIDSRVRADGHVLMKVIGDRRTPIVYGIAENGSLYYSNSNGIDWSLVTKAPEVTDFLLSPARPSLLYSSLPLVCNNAVADDAAQTPLFISTDRGESWYQVTDAPPVEPLWADADDANRVLAQGCDGLYESVDGGINWLPLSTAGDDSLWSVGRVVEIEDAGDLLYALLATDTTGDLVVMSEDDGATWSIISPTDLESPFAASALAVDPDTVGRLWAAGEQGVWVTEDQGQFWGLSASGLEDVVAYGLHDIVYHPRELLYVATEAGFYGKFSTNVNWVKRGVDTVNLRIESLLLTEAAPRRLWLNTEYGVYRFMVR